MRHVLQLFHGFGAHLTTSYKNSIGLATSHAVLVALACFCVALGLCGCVSDARRMCIGRASPARRRPGTRPSSAPGDAPTPAARPDNDANLIRCHQSRCSDLRLKSTCRTKFAPALGCHSGWDSRLAGRPHGRLDGRLDGCLDGRPDGRRRDGRRDGRPDGRPDSRPDGRPAGLRLRLTITIDLFPMASTMARTIDDTIGSSSHSNTPNQVKQRTEPPGACRHQGLHL